MSINFYLILTINVVISTLVVNFKEQVSKTNGKTILQTMLNTTKGGTGFPYAHVKYYLKILLCL
jgi:hypothetical protein